MAIVEAAIADWDTRTCGVVGKPATAGSASVSAGGGGCERKVPCWRGDSMSHIGGFAAEDCGPWRSWPSFTRHHGQPLDDWFVPD